jgi:hypothetical protein
VDSPLANRSTWGMAEIADMEQAFLRALEALKQIQNAPRRQIVYAQEGPRVYAFTKRDDLADQVPAAREFARR